jgi:hypothetical protein
MQVNRAGGKVKADTAKLLELSYAWAGFGLFAVVGSCRILAEEIL